MSRGLSGAYAYLRIAEVYCKASQHDKALLGGNGPKAFPRTHRCPAA